MTTLEVHHVCLTDHARDVLECYAKRVGRTVDDVLEDIVNASVEEIATREMSLKTAAK